MLTFNGWTVEITVGEERPPVKRLPISLEEERVVVDSGTRRVTCDIPCHPLKVRLTVILPHSIGTIALTSIFVQTFNISLSNENNDRGFICVYLLDGIQVYALN